MFNEILKQIHEKIVSHQYVMTIHAEEEMSEDGLVIYDIEQGILTGKILERQRDRVSGESKYQIRGSTLDGEEVEIIVKLSPTGKVVIITVYAL